VARIDGYTFGRVVVDGVEQTKDLIVLPDRVVADWWRKKGHSLAVEDLSEVWDELPERLIVGTGAAGEMVPARSTLRRLRECGVEVEVLRTDQAIRRYAELDPAHTACALHLTC
jgi:hypothetical protein